MSFCYHHGLFPEKEVGCSSHYPTRFTNERDDMRELKKSEVEHRNAMVWERQQQERPAEIRREREELNREEDLTKWRRSEEQLGEKKRLEENKQHIGDLPAEEEWETTSAEIVNWSKKPEKREAERKMERNRREEETKEKEIKKIIKKMEKKLRNECGDRRQMTKELSEELQKKATDIYHNEKEWKERNKQRFFIVRMIRCLFHWKRFHRELDKQVDEILENLEDSLKDSHSSSDSSSSAKPRTKQSH